VQWRRWARGGAGCGATQCAERILPGRFNTRKGISRKTSIVFFPEFYACVLYMYIILRARWAERKTLFAAVVAVYNGCTITMRTYIYRLLESESESETASERGVREGAEPLYMVPLSKGPFSLGLFLFPTNDPPPQTQSSRIRAHTHAHTPGVVSTTGAVYGARSFYGRSFVFFLLLFRSCGVDKQVCPPLPPMSRTHFDRNA